MNIKIRKIIFSIFLVTTFLAGWYFYIVNTKTPYMEYMDNMQSDAPTQETTQSNEESIVVPTYNPNIEPEPTETSTPTPTTSISTSTLIPTNTFASTTSTLIPTNTFASTTPTTRRTPMSYSELDPLPVNILEYESDKVKTDYSEFSDNPMDSNWGGVLYTQESVESGKYIENTRILDAAEENGMGIGIYTRIQNKPKNVFA